MASFAKEETWHNIKLYCELEGVILGAVTGKELWAAGALVANEAERLTAEQYGDLCELWWEKRKRAGGGTKGYQSPTLFEEDQMFSVNSNSGRGPKDRYLRNRVAAWVAK